MLSNILKSATNSVPPEFIASAFSGSSATSRTSYSQPIPSGSVGDDLFIVAADNGSPDWAALSGWTLVAQYSAASLVNRFALYHKKATAASESNVTVTANGSQLVSGVCLRFRHVANCVYGELRNGGASAGAPLATTGITINKNNSLLIMIFVIGEASRSFSTPSASTVLFRDSDATSPSIGIFSKPVNAGTNVQGSSSLSTSSTNVNRILIGLEP